MESVEQVKRIIKYDLYSELEEEEKEKRLRIIPVLETKLKQTTLPTITLAPVYNHWALFYAQVHSLEHITQKKGEDDYCLFYPGKDKLYVSKEMFLRLPDDLVTEFLFSELVKGRLSGLQVKQLFPENYSRESIDRNQTTLDKSTRLLVRSRVIPHSVQTLATYALDYAREIIEHEKDGHIEMPDELRRYHQTRVIEQLEAVISTKQREVCGFVTELDKILSRGERVGPVLLCRKLGDIFVWNAKASKLIKKIRLEVAEGVEQGFSSDIDTYDFMRENFSKFCPSDIYLRMESGDLIGELIEYGREIEGYADEFYQSFNNALSRIDSGTEPENRGKLVEEAKVNLSNLQNMRDGLPENMPLEVQQTSDYLTAKLDEMNQKLAKYSP